MDYLSNYMFMRSEVSLVIVIISLVLYDLIAGAKGMKYFQVVAIALLTLHTVFNLQPCESGSAFGGMYSYVPVMGVVKTILNIAVIIIFLQAAEVFNRERLNNKKGEYYFITLITLLGFYFMISSGHFLMFYIGLEMASIPLATLAALEKYSNKSAEAGAKYILSATFSSGIMLFGISYLYGTTGTLYFADMPAMIDANALQIMAFVFFAAGMFFKISLVPFHLWAPDVYEGAPTVVTSYLSVVSKGAAAFVLMLLLYKVFGNLFVQWQGILYGLIIASITLANLFAIRQKNLKRFLAFSSISQAGYIVLGIVGGTAFGMTALVYYIFVYLFSNLAAFGVVTSVENHSGKVNIDDYKGLYATNPRISLAMMLAMFSLGGIPPLAGFFSKFFVFAVALEKGFYLLVLVAVINTIVSLYYYLLVVKAMFIDSSENPIQPFRTDAYNKASLILCTAGILVVGLFSFFMDKIALHSFGM